MSIQEISDLVMDLVVCLFGLGAIVALVISGIKVAQHQVKTENAKVALMHLIAEALESKKST